MNAKAPDQIGRYRVLDRLGTGGMGTVYRAYDEKLRRDVAIKLLHVADHTAATQILREARASSALNHPGICTVYEVEDEGDQAFIVMELVDGRPLSELIPDDGLPLESVRAFGLQVADALAHAHARNIAHRDVKPANVLISREGRVKVLDFGLARHLAPQMVDRTTQSVEPLSAVGGLVGTLPYMAPEQLRGEPATARSDVWALGILLYELSAGRRPHTGETPFTLTASILADPPQPLPNRVPSGVRKVILRCLSKDPAARYQDAGHVHAALDALEPPQHRRTSQSTRRSLLRTRVRSLAVLPLENLSAEPDEEFFAEGMTDALITTLAQIGALRVISRTSVMRYKGVRRSLPEIAKELNVDAIVEGTIVRSSGRVRIAAQLIHAATDAHLWARQYETGLRDVLRLQSEVARAIADEIRVQLSPREKSQLARARSVDPAAYETFLRGRHLWYKRSPDSLTKAVEMLQRATTLDPSYALAHAGLADAYVSIAWDLFGVAPPSEAYPKARKAAQRALELDPHCAEAHAALGWIEGGFDWNWSEAERELRLAIELKPQYGPVHIWYSHYLRAMDRTEESLAESRRALECDPLGLILNMHLGWHHLYSRQYEKAVEQCLKTIELDSAFILAHLFLGQSYEQLGRFSEAIASFERIVELSQRHPAYLAELGHAYAVAGKRTEALKVIDELIAMSLTRYVAARGIAEIHIGLNDNDEAFAWLDKAFEQRNGWLIHTRENPRYDGLRSDPRYLNLVSRMNFP